jgi:hypothetical protein
MWRHQKWPAVSVKRKSSFVLFLFKAKSDKVGNRPLLAVMGPDKFLPG